MDWDFIVNKIFMTYCNVGVVLAAYFLPKKFIEPTYDGFKKFYIIAIGFAIVFVLAEMFSSRYESKEKYIVSQLIIFGIPYLLGLERAFVKSKNKSK